MLRRGLATLVAATIGLSAPIGPVSTATAAVAPRASLPAVEARVMCVTCKIPLMVADSPQANRERAYIKGLIAAGLTVPEIEQAMVGQYGPSVLGLPRAHGFDLTVYLVPVLAVLALAAALALLLPRWRRRARDAPSPAPPLASADAARLDADMAQFDR